MSNYRNLHALGFSLLACVLATGRTMGGACAVSDASEMPSAEGCMLAFTYNQTDDHRLVVIDETNRHRYEAPLKESQYPPFWEDGKVYVVNVSGVLQGFRISSDKLLAEKEETISAAAIVREIAYNRSQRRLYLIRTGYDNQRNVLYDLLALDFPSRKTIWTKRIDEAGVLRVFEPYICIMGQKLVQVFGCESGAKIAGIEAAKAIASINANAAK
jgi:hypothetical protein